MIEKEGALIFGILLNAIIDHIERSMEPNVMLTILGQELTITLRYNDTTSSRDDDIIYPLGEVLPKSQTQSDERLPHLLLQKNQQWTCRFSPR